jgi:hypothetical protein
MNVNVVLHATMHEAPWIVVLKCKGVRFTFKISASTASADVADRAAVAV